MNAMQGVKYNTTTHTLPLMRLQTKSVGNRGGGVFFSFPEQP